MIAARTILGIGRTARNAELVMEKANIFIGAEKIVGRSLIAPPYLRFLRLINILRSRRPWKDTPIRVQFTCLVLLGAIYIPMGDRPQSLALWNRLGMEQSIQRLRVAIIPPTRACECRTLNLPLKSRAEADIKFKLLRPVLSAFFPSLPPTSMEESMAQRGARAPRQKKVLTRNIVI